MIRILVLSVRIYKYKKYQVTMLDSHTYVQSMHSKEQGYVHKVLHF